MLNALVDLLDVGSGAPQGTLEVLTSGDVLLAEFDLDNPAFGAAASGVATAEAIADTTAGASGTAAKWAAKNRDGTTVMSGNAGLSGSGASLILSNTTVNSGDPMSVLSWTITQPAS
jgi:hypothetical protein